MTTPGWTNSSSAERPTTSSPRGTTDGEGLSEVTIICLSVFIPVILILVTVVFYLIYGCLKNKRLPIREEQQLMSIVVHSYIQNDDDDFEDIEGLLVPSQFGNIDTWGGDLHPYGISEAGNRTLENIDTTTVEQGIDPAHRNIAMATQKKTSGFLINETLDKYGGELGISGVKLTVPPGALISRMTLQLGIMHEERHRPTENLGDRYGMLSPIVCCNPHEHKFKRPVTLSIPHCSGHIFPGCLHILYSDTPSGVSSKWTMLDSSRCDVVITDQQVRLTVDHFCLFVVVGDPSYKFVKLISFAPHLNVDHTFPIRVYCVNNYDDCKSVEMDETRLGGRLQHAAQPLTVHNDGQHVCVNITHSPDNWELISSSKPNTVWQFLLVWHAQTPNSVFILKPTNATVNEFSCRIDGFQMGHDEDKCELSISCEQHFKRLVDPGKHEIFKGHLRTFLIQKLDPPIVAVNTWPALAEHMGLQDELSWLQYQEIHHHESPTKYLLACWEDRCQSESQHYKYLREFLATMEELERHDIVAELTTYLNDSGEDVNYQNRRRDSNEDVDSGLASGRTDAIATLEIRHIVQNIL